MSAKYLVLLLFASLVLVGGIGSVNALDWNSTKSIGLVSYWKLNETLATNRTIDSVNGYWLNFTSNTGWSIQGGKINNSVFFAAANVQTRTQNMTQFNMSQDWTMRMWVNPSTGNQMLWYYNQGTNHYCEISSTYKIYCDNNTASGTGNIALLKNNWTMIDFVFNSTNKSTALYINGTFDLNFPIKWMEMSSSKSFCFGSMTSTYHAFNSGKIDEVFVANRTWLPGEIADDFNGGAGMTWNNITAAPPTDTCTYSGSGAWNINCHDNCTISSNVALGGNTLNISGDGGVITLLANITGTGTKFIAGASSTNQCKVYCLSGNCIQ